MALEDYYKYMQPYFSKSQQNHGLMSDKKVSNQHEVEMDHVDFLSQIEEIQILYNQLLSQKLLRKKF